MQYAPAVGPTTPDVTFSSISYTIPLGDSELRGRKVHRGTLVYSVSRRRFQSDDGDELSPLRPGGRVGDQEANRNSYVELLWYGENLTSTSMPMGSVNLFNASTTAAVSLTGNDLSINFGANGITSLLTETGVTGTGKPTTNFGDGWYALGIDPTGNPGNGQVFWFPFFRLFGSATGDPTVTGPYTAAGTDASVVYNAEGEEGTLLDADVDGSGAVNSKDLTYTVAAKGDSVGSTPPTSFPQFQLFAGCRPPRCRLTPVARHASRGEVALPEAIDAWQAAGLDDADVRKLANVTIQVGNLGTSILGLEAAGVIMINQTAAGFNWYVGAGTSSGQAFGLAGPAGESLAGPGSPAANDVDLLTVLEHELGHVIGLADNDLAGDLMDITLGLGVRRAPAAGDLAAISQGSIAVGMATAAAPVGGVTAGVQYSRSFATVDAALASIVSAPARHGDADDLIDKKIARPVMAVRHSAIGAGHAARWPESTASAPVPWPGQITVSQEKPSAREALR